ncbi:MAG: DUF2520 domain-containing protein [Actinobacteria bacterium]|nr:DUF2520 domain-containing protein [Actinomycetota bacterium]
MDSKIVIIGAGKAGVALGILLKSAGYDIAAVCSKHKSSLKKASSYLDGFLTTDAVEAAKTGDIIFLSVRDNQIKDLCDSIAAKDGFKKGNYVFHLSGALSVDVLKKAEKRGAKIGCIHPIQSFADIKGAIKNLPGSYFGITGDKSVLLLAKRIVKSLKGKFLIIEDKDKPIYHIAACVVSNYLVSLINYAENLYKIIGINESDAFRAFYPLIKGTLDNIEKKGTIEALTGPIVRGDTEVILKHIEQLKKKLPDELSLYRELGLAATEIAFKRKSINRNTRKDLINILKGVKTDG